MSIFSQHHKLKNNFFICTKTFTYTFITRLKSLLKHQNLSEIGWLIFGQFVAIVLGFVSMKLLSSMGTKEFGKYSLVLTIAAFVSAILYGPVEQGFIRFFYDYSNKGLAKTYISMFYKFLLVGGLLCSLITILAIFFNSFMETTQEAIEILIMGLFVIIFTSSNIYNSLLNILRKRKINTIIQITEKILIIVFLFFISIYNKKLTANIGLLAILIALLIVIIIKTKVLNTYVPNDIVTDKKELKKTRKEVAMIISTFSLPFAIWGLTGWLQSNSERWIIAQYLSTADVGIFSLMAVLANYLVAIPSGIISQFAQPIIYEKSSLKNNINEKEEGFKAFNYYLITIIGLVIFSTIFSTIFGRQLILLVSNEEFILYWHILPVLCIGLGLFTIGQSLTTLGIIQNVPKIYLFPKVATGIIAVLSNIIFINYLGIMGIALSICFTSFFYLLVIIYINKKIRRTLLQSIIEI